MYQRTFCASALACLVASGVNAEELGTLPARSMDPAQNQDPSIEGFYRQYSDGNYYGARLGFRLNESVLVYGDFAKADFDLGDNSLLESEGDGFGGGFYYYLPQYSTDYFMAFRASYHTADFDVENTVNVDTNAGVLPINIDGELTELSAQIMLSAKEPLSDNGLRWFAGAGVVKTETEVNTETTDGRTVEGLNLQDDETDPLLSLGVFLPVSSGEAYAGIDYADGSVLGIGYRLYF